MAAPVIYTTGVCHDSTYGEWGYARTLDVGQGWEQINAHGKWYDDLPGTIQSVKLSSVWMHTNQFGWQKMNKSKPVWWAYWPRNHSHRILIDFHWARYIGSWKIIYPGNDYVCRVTIPPRR